MKDKVKNLVQQTRLIDHLPHGSINEISRKLNKERGTVRGALQGKWVNVEVIDESILLIESEIQRLKSFLNEFKSDYKKFK